MLYRQGLRINDQEYKPVSGSQFIVKYPKSIEVQTIQSWSDPGKGQQGESVTGAPYQSQVIRKGQSRAT